MYICTAIVQHAASMVKIMSLWISDHIYAQLVELLIDWIPSQNQEPTMFEQLYLFIFHLNHNIYFFPNICELYVCNIF